MPKMRILSGEQKGAIVEMNLPEAQNAYCTGFAELFIEEQKPKPAAKVEAKPAVEEPKKSKGSKRGG